MKSISKDIENLISNKYTFEEIIHEIYVKESRFFNRDIAYETMKFLYGYFPGKVEECAENIFEYDISNYQDVHKSDRKQEHTYNLYINLYCIAVLLESDENKYEKYKDLLVDFYTDNKMTSEMITILFKCSRYDERLFSILKYKILNDYYTGAMIELNSLQGEKFLEYLVNNNIKTYPYYRNILFSHKSYRSNIIKQLFIENKQCFYETYEFSKDIRGYSYQFLFMCAVMLNNNEGREILEEVKLKLSHYVGNTMRVEDGEKTIYDFIISDDKGLKLKAEYEFKKMLERKMNIFVFGDFPLLVEVFSVLYDFDESAKTFIDFLIINTKKYSSISKLCVLMNVFLKTRKKWLNSEEKNDIEMFIDNRMLEVRDVVMFLGADDVYFELEGGDNIFNLEFMCYKMEKYHKEVLKLMSPGGMQDCR